jgi:DNA-binding MarR family transcriptional regulator
LPGAVCLTAERSVQLKCLKRTTPSGSNRKGRRATAAAASDEGDGEARAVLDSVRLIVQTLRISSRAAEREVGVSAAQLFVLTKLAAARKPLSVGDLAEHTLTHQSSVSVVVQKLERQGLVARSRSSDDARRVELSLTPAARALLRKAPQAAQDKILNAVAAMPAARRKQLADLLGDLARRIGGEQRPAMLFEDEQASRS